MGLLDFFSKKPAPTPQQPGGLLSAAPVIVSRQAYNDYAEHAMVKGKPVMKYEDWAKAQQVKK